MKLSAFLFSLMFIAAFAAPVAYTERPIEAAKTGNVEALLPAAALAVNVAGNAAKANIRCDARLRWRSGGYHNRCPWGRLVTGVQVLDGNLAVLDCAEVEVTCR
jgi:hypothetical protein